ncbi:MAG: C1 family peptidase [Muribaculaceae bacterium]|nr:C1 family peptidase [Muribaculaceae bacterium]
MTKRITLSIFALVTILNAFPDNNGEISADMLRDFRASYEDKSANKARHNALNAAGIEKLAFNEKVRNNFDDHFSHKVETKGITDQKSSGRCWLFTGLNVLRAQAIAKHNLPKLTFSQNYNFFFDQLEKANLFLQGVIDTSDKPMEDRQVEWLFQNPIADGGTFCGVADIVTKYGVVPTEVMAETEVANSTSAFRRHLATRLREDGLRLRQAKAKGADEKALQDMKTKQLGEVYKMLALTLGEPPTEFTWTKRDSKGNAIETKTYTPQSFYKELLGNDLKNDYIMLMNDPSREYWKVYRIDYDRHSYDGQDWTYLNVPMADLKDAAIKSIKDSTAMYFSCDVGKFLDRERGTLDLENFDYESLFDTKFGMDKAERISTWASASSHAMTLSGVDLDAKGDPQKWLIENSWGKSGHDGYLIATDDWMDEYLFRLVVDKKYVSPKILKALKQEPVTLPSWDHLFITN